MTELERGVADALRLSEKAAENGKILRTIQRNIKTARSELVRAGVSDVIANSNHPLVEDAIITFCLSKMDDEDMQERHREAFEYQEDNLRKSTIVIEEKKEEEAGTGEE